MAKTSTGIRKRGSSWEAWVYDKRTKRKIRRTFDTLAAAKGWRADASSALRKGTMRAPTQTTLREAWNAWLAGAQDGGIRTRSGDPYKPSTLAGYEQTMTARVLGDLGGARLDQLERLDWQDLADRMLAAGDDASTIRNTLMPVRAVYRRTLERGELAVNPTSGLRLPAVRGRRDRIASGRSGAAPVRAAGVRSAAMGDGDVRGPAPRRAVRAPLRGRRPARRPDPR